MDYMERARDDAVMAYSLDGRPEWEQIRSETLSERKQDTAFVIHKYVRWMRGMQQEDELMSYYYHDTNFEYNRSISPQSSRKRRNSAAEEWETDVSPSEEDDSDDDQPRQDHAAGSVIRRRKQRKYSLFVSTPEEPLTYASEQPHFSLHVLPTASLEYAHLSHLADNDESETRCTLVGILQVRNASLFKRFEDKVYDSHSTSADLIIGFHSTRYNDLLPVLLNEGLDPRKSQPGEYGYGSYFGSTVNPSLKDYVHEQALGLRYDRLGAPYVGPVQTELYP
jgi:hypothetical protein